MAPIRDSLNMGNEHSRVLACAAMIAGGVALGVAMPGTVVAAGGVTIAGILGSIFAGDLSEVWKKRKFDPRHKHPNEDLTRLVGDAIERVLRDCAEHPELPNTEARQWCAQLAEKASALWVNLAPAEGLEGIAETELPEIFAKAAKSDQRKLTLLDPAAWHRILDNLRDAAKLEPNPDAMRFAVDQLHTGLFHEIRERAKLDFVGDGLAYAAINLDTQAKILAGINELLKRQASQPGSQEQNRELQNIRESLAKLVEQQQAKLTPEQVANLQPVLDDLNKLSLQVWKFRAEHATHEAREKVRSRRLLVVSITTAILVGGGILFVRCDLETVREDTVVSREDTAAIREMLEDYLSEKQLRSPGEDPPPLTPEILAKAQILIAQDDKRDRLTGYVVARNEDEALPLLEEMKRDATADLFDLYALEGDLWYGKGEYDKAIEPYEKAQRLKPENIGANIGLANSLISARLGDIAENQKRAIALFENSLSHVETGSRDWVLVQNNLGIAWQRLPVGDLSENIAKAIAFYEVALNTYTRSDDPIGWASTKNNLGTAWYKLPTGDRDGNLTKAIAFYEAALEVRTRDAHPAEWASTQRNLGIAWQDLPTGDRAENLKRALACYEAALEVRTRDAHPEEWASLQDSLGNVWQDMPTGDRTENIHKAIAFYEAALEVRTRETHPQAWAGTQNNLGNAWQSLPTGEPGENTTKAVACFEAALEVYTREAYPVDWAIMQNNLGITWNNSPTGDRSENISKAVACFEAALEVRTREAHPMGWATTTNNLGVAWLKLQSGDRRENIQNAAKYFVSALTIWTADAFPHDHTLLRSNIMNCMGRYVSERHGTSLDFDAMMAGAASYSSWHWVTDG